MTKNNNLYFISDKDNEILCDEWKKEWKNMPEFNMNNPTKIFKKLTLQFETQEDVNDFIELTNIKITEKTKVIFFPKKERKKVDRCYVDK